jgi:carbon monoxide dehydrogenase subunit G
MKVTGRAILPASRAAVFAAICDPGALLEIIPGCQEIHQVSADEYRGRISIRLPAIVGSYDTTVRMVESDPPAYGAFDGRVEGRVGGLAGRASFRLAEDVAGTLIEYDGTAVVSGPLARLDSRFIEGLAASLVDDGLARLGRRLEANAAVDGSNKELQR